MGLTGAEPPIDRLRCNGDRDQGRFQEEVALGGPFCPEDPNLYRVQDRQAQEPFLSSILLFLLPWLLQGSFHPGLQSGRETARGSSLTLLEKGCLEGPVEDNNVPVSHERLP